MLKICTTCLLAMLVFLCLFSGCERVRKSSPSFSYSPDVEADVYYPLALDNAWTYDVAIFDVAGNITEKGALITRVVAREGETVRLLSGSQTVVYRIGEKGIFKQPSGQPLIPEPVVEGAEWPLSIGDVSGVGRIVSVSQNMIAPGGVFKDCLLIEERFADGQMIIRSWFAPNVGLARMEEILVIDGQELVQMRATLRIYKVNAQGDGSA